MIVNVAVVAHCPADGVNVYFVVSVLFKAGAHVPVIPLSDVVGNAVNAAPEQIAAIGLNVGVVFELTVIVNEVVVAHCPAVGVNVYVVVSVLFKAGAHVPVIPLSDVVGNAAKAAPEQIALTGLNVGAVLELTVIVNVAVVAHCPAVGVNVYVVVSVLFKAGAHVPVIPLSDVVGNAVNAVPEQIAAIGLNVGVVFGLTVIANVAVFAHCPVEGVNVYVVVSVLFKAGAHVPVIPLSEVVGKAASAAPEQIAATGLNVGVVFGLTVIVNVAVVAHCPAVGVNVYVVVKVLFKAGAQVPVIPLSDVVGKAASAAPEQIAATGLNVGVTTVSIVTEVVATTPGQPPLAGTV